MTTCLDAGAGVTSDLYRAVFRRYGAGVVVITADAGSGPAGFTATSLASVSLHPPMVSFALSTSASSWPTIAIADTVVGNFLAADQRPIAERFATSGIDRFAEPTCWSRLPGGEPVLDLASGHLRARIEHRHPTGDHHLVVAQVIDAATRHHTPLIYHAGSYSTVTALQTA